MFFSVALNPTNSFIIFLSDLSFIKLMTLLLISIANRFSGEKALLHDNLVQILNSFFLLLLLQDLCLDAFLRFPCFYQKLNCSLV